MFAAELGFLQLTFKGDSEVVIKALSIDNSSLSSVGHISGSFEAHTFSHISRQGNIVAHASAERAKLFVLLVVWRMFH